MTILHCQVVLASIALVAGDAASRADELSGSVLVFAAASTANAVDQVRADFGRAHPRVSLRVSFAASSTLARQISVGAAADVFLSASVEWVDALAKEHLVDQQRNLLSNQLVIIVPADSSLNVAGPSDLVQAKIGRLALADPRSVPAGVYARDALERLGLWDQLEGRVAGAVDVRQALQFVATGAAEAGIVYSTDAAASRRVRVVAHLDSSSLEPIRYPLVLTNHGAQSAAAVAFFEYAQSPAAAAVFRKHGFVVLAPSVNAGK